MERGPSINSREAKQAHDDKILELVNELADFIQDEKAGELTAPNLIRLFNLTAKSLFEHGLVEQGRIYETIENGEVRETTDLFISAYEAQEKVLDRLGATDAGGWGGHFPKRAELVDYMNEAADKFEQELTQILEDKEVIHHG